MGPIGAENHLIEPAAETREASRQSNGETGDVLLARALARARWTVFWERLWPALATLATAVGLFLAASWLGLWLWLPPLGRAFVLFGFAVLTAVATFPLL